ncbi:Hsp20 family protein [Legionella tunisiensis]|uniref:Hsp20 family protein n=1 Tax=Legionella tunisiensis TaxID=1034944 RepID=UPI00031BF1AB
MPKGADSKVNVSVKEGQLIVSSNVTQKITREQDNSKSVSYSQSNYNQVFQLPKGYDPNSMTTKTNDSNLIVILKIIIEIEYSNIKSSNFQSNACFSRRYSYSQALMKHSAVKGY